MDKYIMYLRKSQMDRDFEEVSVQETLNRHRQTLTSFCQIQKINVTDILEEVVSGESLAARPQMMKCLEMVNTGEFAGVVCMDIDRLSRGSGMDSGYIMQILQVNNCKIVTPQKTYDLTNDSDEQFTDMKFLFSRYELKTISKRLMRGRNQSASEGKFLGSNAPFGYVVKKISGEKGNTLEINPEEAEIVKLIFDMYTNQNMGVRTIEMKLQEMGVKGVTKRIIDNAIHNPVYIGKMRWKNTVQEKHIEDGKIVKRRVTNDNPELYDGQHEPIISEETFNKAQICSRQRLNHACRKDRVLKNPFAGILVCGNCGRVFNIAHKSMKQLKDPSKARIWFKCATSGCTSVV